MKNSFDLIAAAIWSLVIRIGRRFNGRAFFIAGIAFFFAAQSLMSTGTIKGKVIDKGTKDKLPGANIIVKGTSIGTVTDLDGV